VASDKPRVPASDLVVASLSPLFDGVLGRMPISRHSRESSHSDLRILSPRQAPLGSPPLQGNALENG
jgi:hypothetical protein